MAQLNKIDSNVTGLRYCEEDSYKTVSGDEVWYPLEPNSYSDFGGNIITIARNPINSSRQRKKGVVTDLDASGGFDSDITQSNLQNILQGFFFATRRDKDEYGGGGEITGVATSTDEYAGTDIEDDFTVGDLIFASGFTNSGNNGLKTVASVTGPNTLGVSENLVDEAAPPSAAKLVRVGVVAGAGDLDVDVSGSLPVITSSVLDFTTLDLIPGEWIFVGGDSAGLAFSNAENNGFKRIRSVAANALTLDKSTSTMVVEASTTETVQLFFGRVLKNELDTDIVRRTYQLERTLGAPDDTQPAQIQAEYLVGAVPNELTINIPTAEKATVDLSFIAADHETIDGPTSLKAGTRPALVEADAFNTSSDISRIHMAQVVAGDEAPTALFAYLTELSFNINNNVSPNKAVGVLGAFEVTAGTFAVSGELTAYFSNVSAIAAVRANADVTIDAHLVKDNAGISIDLPLISLGDGRANVEQDQPITLPISMDAATAAKIDADLDYTMLMMFWDYLPDAADV